MSNRIQLLACALFTALAFLTAAPAQAEIETTDLTGRRIVLAEPAHRILIDDSRYLVALSLIHPDPVSLLSAWPRDINRLGAETYRQYAEKFPAIEKLALTASSAGTFSVEQVLGAQPDLAIFSLQSQPGADDIARLEAAGVPVAIIDFFDQPLENLEPSLRLLGDVTGRRAEADAFLAFRRAHMDAIAARVAAASGPRPRVFLEPHAARTDECCASPGRGNIGNYIEFAGGENIGNVLQGVTGTLNLEYVISADPQVYIATGGPHMESTAGLLIGPGYDEKRIRETLARVTARNGISGLAAAREHRVHGLSHQLLNSPLDILTVEALAKWIRPDLFPDLDPEKTRQEINERFLAVPIEGTYWVDLN